MFPKNKIGASLRRYHFLITLLITVFILGLEGVFLYRYFYRVLGESKALIELKQQAAVDELNFPLYERIKTFYEARQKPNTVNWGTLRDPFASAPSAPSGAATPPR